MNDLKKFINEYFDVNKILPIKTLHIVKKKKNNIVVNNTDAETYGLKYRGNPSKNKKCNSMHYQDFLEAYELYSDSKPKRSKLGRFSYSELLYTFFGHDIILKKIDFVLFNSNILFK